MKTKVNDIQIIYSESQQACIDNVIKMIQNNYEIIDGCIDDKIIDITDDKSNFNDTFYYIVNAIYNNEKNKELFNCDDYLSALYYELLTRKNKSENSVIKPNLDISDQMLSSFIAYKYYEVNGTFDEFVEFLKYRKNEKEMFDWLRKVARWDTYNFLLSSLANVLTSIDEDFLNLMNFITNIWIERIIDKPDDLKKYEEKYDKISKEKMDELFYEFLNYVKAPDGWLRTYNMLRENNYIKFKKDSKRNDSMCFLADDGKYKILVSNGDNIRGFCDLVHEFVHYISGKSNFAVKNLAISEFPSIFFEKIAVIFLINKGYASDMVNHILDEREYNNYTLCSSLMPLFIDLFKYNNGHVITKDEKIAFFQMRIDSVNRVRNKFLKKITDAGIPVEDKSIFEELNIDIEKHADDDCDFLTESFIKNGVLVINGFQYLLDSYLAEEIIKKRKDDSTIVEKMIGITNNFAGTSVKNIITLFGIEDSFQDESGKNKTKTRRL